MRVSVVNGRDGPWANWEAAINLAEVAGLEVRHNLLDRWAQVNKRAMDIVLSTLGMIACAPLILLLAVAVRLDSAGPVLFRQIVPVLYPLFTIAPERALRHGQYRGAGGQAGVCFGGCCSAWSLASSAFS